MSGTIPTTNAEFEGMYEIYECNQNGERRLLRRHYTEYAAKMFAQNHAAHIPNGTVIVRYGDKPIMTVIP